MCKSGDLSKNCEKKNDIIQKNTKKFQVKNFLNLIKKIVKNSEKSIIFKFMKKSNPEDLECEAFKYWLNSKNYRFTHVANEIGVGGLIGIKIGSRNKKI